MRKYEMNELNLKKANINSANRNFLDDIFTFHEYLFEKGGIKLNGGLIPPAYMKDIVKDFIYPVDVKRKRKESKVPYLFVIDTISRMMGLAEVQANVLFSRSSEIDEFNKLSYENKMKKIYDSYIVNDFIDETLYIQRLKINWKNKDYTKKELLINIRKNISNAISSCDKGYWYSIGEFAKLIDTEELYANIETAKYGMMWLIYKGESHNEHIILNMLISYILDTYLRHTGLVSTYKEVSGVMEEMGINNKLVTMFEYKSF